MKIILRFLVNFTASIDSKGILAVELKTRMAPEFSLIFSGMLKLNLDKFKIGLGIELH